MLTQANAETVIARLADGWKAGHSGSAHALVDLLHTALETPIEIKEEGDDFLEFRMSLSNVRLRGADDIRGLIVGGSSRDSVQAIRVLAAGSGVPGRIHLVCAVSTFAYGIAREKLPPRAALLLSPSQLVRLLTHPKPLLAAKTELRHQLGRLTLLPFDIEHPAPANMFFGRRNELELLGGSSSVAIAGPGRIGKTSLLLEYRRRLVRYRDARMHTTFFVDFYSIAEKSANGVSQFLAMKLNPTRKNFFLTAGDLLHFLRSERARLGAPLELLLDEVDEVITINAFDTLGMAAREGLCRLVLSGKSVLFEQIYRRQSTLASRVELIRPKPLSPQESMDLVLQPFLDLGFTIQDEQRLTDAILELTGGLPQHAQYLGGRLFRSLEQSHKNELSVEDIHAIKTDFEFVHYLRAAFKGLENKSQAVAMELLKQRERTFDASVIQEAHRQLGLTVPSLLDAADLGDSLVISNFLSWSGHGYYKVACPAMVDLVPSN